MIKPYESFEMVLRVSNLLQTRFLSLQAEERSRTALRQEEERFRAVFQQSAVGMTLTDPGGRFMQVNSAFCEFLGYTAAELEKMSVAEVTDPADEEVTRLQLDELRAGTRGTLDLHKRYRRKDGGTAWGHVSGVFIFDGNRQPVYAIAIIQDITVRKQAEMELARAKEEWAQSFDGMPDLICVLDMEGRILRANRAMRSAGVGSKPIEPPGCSGMRFTNARHSCARRASCAACSSASFTPPSITYSKVTRRSKTFAASITSPSGYFVLMGISC